jgi:hypothetical protein
VDWRIQVNATHHIMLVNLGGTPFTDASTSLANNTWYRIDVSIISATSYRIQLYAGDSVTALFDTGVQSYTATVATNEIDVGICNSGSGITRLDIDDCAVGSGGLLGRPAGLSWAAPTIAPMTSIDKNVGDTYSITAVPTLGDGTAFTVYEWTIVEQSTFTPTLTLTGAATVTVSGTVSKAGALVLQFRAKDNGGSLGSVDTWSAYQQVTVYVSEDLGTAVHTRDLIGSTTWTAIGSGSVDDGSDSTGMRSPDDPVAQTWVRRMQPIKAGAIVFTLRGLKVGAADISRLVEIFTDSTMTTRVYQTTITPLASATSQTVTVDSAGLALVSTTAACRTLTVKVTSTKV